MGNALALIDQQLVEAAANNLSPQEMEQRFDVPAAQAYLRVKEVLASRDVWSEIERKQLLLESAYRMKAKLEDFDIDPSEPKQVEAYTKLLITIDNMLDKQHAITTEDLNTVTAAMARKLLMIFERATEHAIGILSNEYPNVFIEDLRAALDQGLERAGEEIE